MFATELIASLRRFVGLCGPDSQIQATLAQGGKLGNDLPVKTRRSDVGLSRFPLEAGDMAGESGPSCLRWATGGLRMKLSNGSRTKGFGERLTDMKPILNEKNQVVAYENDANERRTELRGRSGELLAFYDKNTNRTFTAKNQNAGSGDHRGKFIPRE